MSSLFLLPQNMLVEIEQKVVALSELSVHNDNLLLEGKARRKDEAEQLAAKLRTLKGSLLELQRALHDKQLNIQVRAAASDREAAECWCAAGMPFLSLRPVKEKVGMTRAYEHARSTQTLA